MEIGSKPLSVDQQICTLNGTNFALTNSCTAVDVLNGGVVSSTVVVTGDAIGHP